jgi:hypothetical protein
MPRVGAVALLTLLLAVTCQSAGAQSRTASDVKGRAEKTDPDNVVRRHQWFRRGRQGVQTKPAAALRLDAYRQMVMRRNAFSAARLSTAQIAATPLTTAQVWSALGPSPILSNPSGSSTADYDYGPVIGRVTSLFVDPSDATGNTVYLGGATGGLWRTSDAASTTPSGVTWSALLDGQPTLSVGAVGIQPGNSNLIILGSGEPDFSIDSYYAVGFLRSPDKGSTWTLISSANSGAGGFTMDLRGIAFSSVVFSTDNPNLVVAGAGASGVGFGSRIETVTDERFGIFYSTDAGQSWTRATFLDSTTLVKPWSVSSIAYNPVQHLFYAAVGFQGIYSSSDGATWSRLTSQPGIGLNLSNCPAYFSTTCPIFRGALGIRPGADEMYVWYVDLNSKDQGIYKTTDGGQTWTALNESGITNCGDAAGCGTEQGFFNLALSAVPQSNGGTDLYAGAVNVFKCSITSANPTCSANPFLNLTHTYGCSPIGSLAHVHPDQHAIAFASGNPQIIYFGNDGGVYRTLNATALSSGSCGGPLNPFDNLNGTMGSMAQFVWLSQDPSNQNILLGGTQDNGSPARTAVGAAWPDVNLGDGGYNAINPASPSEWFTAHTDVSIQRCTLGTSCTPANFSSIVTNSTLAGDVGPFYTPYILDPQAPAGMLVGTCRVWRGPSNGGTGWLALSNNFDTANGSACTANAQNQIQAIAAGGTLTSNGSQVIWVGAANGNIWTTSNADGGPSTWSSRYTTPYLTPVSSIAIDPKDPTGETMFFTTLGFFGGQVVVISPNTITGNPSGDLPNIPANSIIFDPEFPNIMYVGTDIGVFQSFNRGTNWIEVGPGSLPSAPVLHLEVFKAPGTKKLRASTYGRGVWETDLPTGSIPLVSFSSYSVTFAPQAIGTTSSPVTVTLTNIGSASLNLSGFNTTGSEFAQTNNCSATLPAAASCTINITFAPTASGSHTGTLSMTDNSYDSPQVVQLIGNIPTPAIKIIQGTMAFPGVAVGAVFGPLPEIVTSSGTGPLTISNVSATGDFSETDNCVGTLVVNQSCTINVSFRPTVPGGRQGAILITDNASGSPQSISVSGGGIAELVISTNSLQFPNVMVGSSAPMTITLSNFTSAAIGIKQLILQGPNTGDFSQTNNCGTSVASQASCVVNIIFTPTAGDVRWTNLSVIDTSSNTVGALVQGTGTDFALSSSSFPSVVTIKAGQAANFTVWLAGQGAFNGTVSLACKGGPQGSTCTTTPGSAPLTLANPGTAITVSVNAPVQAAANAPAFGLTQDKFSPKLKPGLTFLIVVLLASLLFWRCLATKVPIPATGLILLVLGVLMFAVSCGGGSSSSNPGPPPGPTSYTITVTGTSGALTNSINLTLIVNP